MGIFSKMPFFGEEAVAKSTRKVMLNSYELAKKHNPGFSDIDYMKTAVHLRFRNWNDYQIESYVNDCNDIDELIEKIIIDEKLRII